MFHMLTFVCVCSARIINSAALKSWPTEADCSYISLLIVQIAVWTDFATFFLSNLSHGAAAMCSPVILPFNAGCESAADSNQQLADS